MAPDPDALTRPPLGQEAEVDGLRRQAAELRGQIGTDVFELRRRARSAFDLRRQIARHPLAVAAAVVVGVLAVTWIARSLSRGVWRPGRRTGRAHFRRTRTGSTSRA